MKQTNEATKLLILAFLLGAATLFSAMAPPELAPMHLTDARTPGIQSR